MCGVVKDAFGSKGQLGGAQGAGAGAGSYKPPFKNVEIVYINIKASLYDVKKRCSTPLLIVLCCLVLPCSLDPILTESTFTDIRFSCNRVLGTNASAVLAISNEIGGQSRAVRIRMRGIGSG